MEMQQQQQESSGGGGMSTPPPYSSAGRELLPISQYFEEDAFVNLYSSIVHLKDSPPSLSLSLSSSSPSVADEDAAAASYAAHLALRCHQMERRYGLCLSRLRDATQELDALRQENARLRRANLDLARRLHPLREGARGRVQTQLADELGGLSLGDEAIGCYGGGGEAEGQQQRISLPKSISVRSTGYLKAAGTHRGGRVRVSNPVLLGAAQPVYPTTRTRTSTSSEEEALEFDVYTQGMFKTELCNKWEDSGACPYGDHCQFAHGVAELRPVIRHPRYKTEVCRMVLAGETCPYGHRCHFRHALNPEEHSYTTSFATTSSVTSMAP